MVSFQCDACSDVVKKPKLDQHRGRCHSSFTCLDCSKTFPTPADYKSHTSCVSEAEKYQKALYKGPKNNTQNSRGFDQTGNGRSYGQQQNWNGNQYQGNFQRNGGRPSYQPRNQATGPNRVPLGTSPKMAWTPSPPDSDTDKGTKRKADVEDSAGDEPASKKVKSGDLEVVAEGPISKNGADASVLKKDTKEPKKEKRDKSKTDDSKATEPHGEGSSKKSETKEKTKKDKSEKKSKAEKEGQATKSSDPVRDALVTTETFDDKKSEKKKEKKDKKEKNEKKDDREEVPVPEEPKVVDGPSNGEVSDTLVEADSDNKVEPELSPRKRKQELRKEEARAAKKARKEEKRRKKLAENGAIPVDEPKVDVKASPVAEAEVEAQPKPSKKEKKERKEKKDGKEKKVKEKKEKKSAAS